MNVFKHTIPEARDLEEEPLTDEEVEMLAEGYPPSVLGGLDFEEVVKHLAARLLDSHEELQQTVDHYVGDGFDDI